MAASENKATQLRTIFMGTSVFAETILSGLIKAEYNLVAIYTQPDQKVGREQTLQKSAVKILAEKNQLSVYTPAKLDETAIAEIRQLKPDLLIVAAYGKILPVDLLKLPGFGALNVHASLLPKYRGPSPIQNTLLNGEKMTGTTIMLMDAGIDTGDILSQYEVAIERDESAAQLSQKLAEVSAALLLETLPLWVEKKIKPEKQDTTQASLCQLIERADGKIVWTDEAEAIYNRYRAFDPWPGIYTFWNYNDQLKRLKLTRINYLKNNSEAKHHLGEVFQIGEKYSVQTTVGTVILENVQMEGKAEMTIAEFINGYPNFVGAILK